MKTRKSSGTFWRLHNAKEHLTVITVTYERYRKLDDGELH